MDIMFEVNSDSKQRAALEARRKYREVVTTQKNKIDRLEKALGESQQALGESQQALGESQQALEESQWALDVSQQRIAELEALLAAKS